MSRYLDVSTDPDAAAASGIPDETIARLAEHGVVPLGWVAWRMGEVLGAHVSWVGRTADARALVSVSWWAGRALVSIRTLSEDGRIVITEGRPRWLAWIRVRSAMRRFAKHGFLAEMAPVHEFSALLAEHARRVAAHALVPVAEHDLVTYLATRLRYGQLLVPLAERSDRLRRSCARVATLALSVAWIAASLASRDVLGGWALVTAAGGCLAAWQARAIGDFIGTNVLAPRLTVHDLKRRTPSADELVAEARAIVPSRLPRWRRVRVAHHEIDRVRRIDMLLAFGGSLVFPLAGLLATLRAGIVGAVAVTAAFLAAEGAAELAFGRGTFQAVRRRVLPRLVAAEESLYEDLEPDDAPSPSGAAAGSLFVAIVGALVLLWSRVVPESPPSPAWFTVVWAVVATSHLARASAELRALHDWVVPERESK